MRNIARIAPILLLVAALPLAACEGGRTASAEEVQAAEAAGLRQVRFHSPDIYCMGCVATIKATLEEIGVTAVSADLETRVMTGYYDPSQLTPEAIRQAVERTGYSVEDLQTRES